MQDLILNWWPIILTVIAGIAAWSLNSYKVAQLEKSVELMNINGTIHSRENVIKLEGRIHNQERQQANTQQDTEILKRQLNEMSGDIKVIRAIMEEQKA